ncbi:MAG: alanine racemase [bacterium]
MPTPLQDLARLAAALPRPAALVDLDAFDHNLAALVAAAAGRPIRIATKSLRHRALIRRALDRGAPHLRGLMCHHPAEAAWLAAHGFDDLLVAYPTTDPAALAAMASAVAAGATIRVVADDPAHLAALDRAAAAAGCTLDALVDVDLSPRLGPLHLGVRRSPLRTPAAAAAFARAAAASPRVRLVGFMAYEAHIAGLPHSLANAAFKRLARPAAARRRAAIAAALRDAGVPLTLVNGGGTGSVASSAADPALTELTAGSALLASHLFDGVGLDLAPALFIALEVARRPDARHVTCNKGGLIASGAPGPDRLPRPVWPPGLRPLGMEGAGEVQTPFRCPPGHGLAIGDTVLLRPAKAGEPAERFDRYHLVHAGAVVAVEPTYRGEGQHFG